ncbi:membrane protein [Burkholderia sp. MSh2]|uniref:Membrane protein n=1 Tax=Burkholderia paludis TaxID=1506587 RepID=A0A6J5DLJ2_9BURK|nr:MULTISPECIES: OmpW family outer membrane protein [Burkholderia]KEZ05495.1 membrane protein [Burkholderia sp. MSh2]KFG95693.1 membrane protein [Burkholderia paludis]CAB3755059.1 Outer membrane protein W [Burkholderia paludis]VWB34404.1 membrane protein [Burkholderia paludis]
MKHASAAILLSMSVVSSVYAQSSGQLMINAGWLHMAPQDSSEPLTVNALGRSNTMAGSGASISDADTVALTATYFVTDHIALETILGVPPKLRLTGTGTLAGLGELGTARAWSPAIIAQYHFGEPSARLRPYVGAGISYVWFNGIDLSNPVASGKLLYSPTFGTRLEGPTSVSLSKSFAPILNVGLTYNIDTHWSIGASFAYAWLSTKATITTHSPVGTVTSTTRLKINPIMTFASLGYRF